MKLEKHLIASGHFLFHWRSFLPVALLLPLGFVVANYTWPFASHRLQEGVEAICFLVSMTGVVVRVLVAGYAPAGTSGRNRAEQRAEVLNTTGMYSLCRHPLYLGNFLVGLGWVMFLSNGWFVMLYATVFWLYYERIMLTEEEFLSRQFGDEFEAWAASTNTFVPAFTGWRAPKLTFCWRTALQREYLTWTGMVVVFGLLECVEHLRVEQRVPLEPLWLALLISTLVVFVATRILIKYTTVLHRLGR